MKKRKRLTLILLGGGILFVFIVGEFCLREFWGMCHAPLYYVSNKYEYMACPNQDGYRFGSHYHYNSFSQRSDEPQKGKKKVLGLGDSVLFGGVMLDQDSIATSIFTRETGVQMLNISAGSWGPDNCAAYLKDKGLFGAKAMYLLVSSHDAHDNMNFEPIVGKHPAYPNKQYKLAWAELIERYIWPRTFGKWFAKPAAESDDPDQKVLKTIDGSGIEKKGLKFNPGFDQLLEISKKANIPLYICLHPDAKEVAAGKYNWQGQEIISWCKFHGISPILELKEGIRPDMYRDGIHTNEKGQRFEANLMEKYIKIK